ncbi:MAG TPA: bifunctional diaminohydroxyphosphoribosylaminopyrimidine deaminase/5-amino-6-(5-phosphoribosylamino)uracil reductase RibD [Candidatus Macondimonas sp.]|nr:bifunctional diaminohydroxyphosphoribosylaminopyrimidine deaminase/5-amino-6-(5-phosphoribosylamino)uracil reductase RibD [Candidatus Macondimonas sp.]
MTPVDDARYMARALRLAERGVATTQPNPRVGCVLVADGQIVGEGWHMQAGAPHAEIYALQQAGPRARGATAYITLEPCSHYGRTAPCSEALIAAGVTRVVTAMEDPNPLVRGQGHAQLRAAGIALTEGVGTDTAQRLNAGYIQRMTQGRPRVTLKLGATLDGRTASAGGDSQWITGPAARADVQQLRACSGAILTGSGTVLADDPALNVRLPGQALAPDGRMLPWHQPLRVVLDRRLRMPPRGRLFDAGGTLWIYTERSAQEPQALALREAGAQVATLPPGADLSGVLSHLAGMGVNDVLIEAGPTLAGAFVVAALVDELVVYLAPALLGNEARGMFHLPGLIGLDDRVRLRILEMRAVGEDWRVRAVPDRRGTEAD